MEYLEGETLAARLQKGPLPLADALRIAIEVTSALEKAHHQGVVHRDLKPANLMLTKSGTKLLDFGLAKVGPTGAFAGALTTALPTAAAPLTAHGAILGTFQYMAPEQIEGADADARTDIFAFGALLYEMLTGKRAFEGKTQASLIAAILDREPPPVSTLQPLTPGALDRVIQKCLAKDRDERWQSAKDLGDELRWIAQQAAAPPIVSSRVTRRSRSEIAAWTVALVTALASAAVIFVVGLRRSEQEVATARFEIVTPPTNNITSLAISNITPIVTRVSPPSGDPNGSRRWTSRNGEGAALDRVRRVSDSSAIMTLALPYPPKRGSAFRYPTPGSAYILT
jgi:eukaryotic-like serine/threonine-protein kinase